MKYKKANFKSANFKKRSSFSKKKDDTTFTATVKANERGFAFLIPDDKEKYKSDFFVPASSLGGAYNGDKVLARHIRGTRDEAKILKVLERGINRIVGEFEKSGNIGVLYPDDNALPEVIIPLSQSLNAKDGEKILCEITAYPPKGLPKGKVIEILGESGDFKTEELGIIRSYGLNDKFSEEALKEAKEVSAESVVLEKRKDFREKLIITIDGEDTRDIDDGVSIEVKDGKFHLGVHIADVSHYVKYRSALDNDAYERGTSVYFPDRVYHMLPKELSNGACSLNEGEDRYALSCLITFDEKGERLDYEICESVIKSKYRMTYTAVNAILDGEKQACSKYKELVETARNMQKLCLRLENNRKAAGEIDLDIREAKIYLDEDGNIIIPDYKRGIAERIIEQFMISANEAVAEFLQKINAPCLYRVHETPAPEKTETLISFLKDLGINVRCDKDDVKPKDFQNILKRIEDKPYYSVVNKVMLRCMQKARYCEKNLGHFGLASKCYCHFTSPIRRYPDLFVHRVLKCVFHGTNFNRFLEIANSAGIDCSERERVAAEAERAVDDLYKVVYMSKHIGEVFDATVSGVTNFGVFCELENSVEGLIPIDVLPDDNYEFIAEKFTLKGKKHSYRLGDKLKIRVDNTDFGRMRVTFSLY